MKQVPFASGTSETTPGQPASLPSETVRRTEIFVREKLGTDATGHDWWHTDRVRRLALWLARMEGADLFITEMAALLHDVEDWKFVGGGDRAHGRETVAWLFSSGVEPVLAARICAAIDDVSFKGAGVSTLARSREAAAVQDADRLEALGAIGIARAFAYGGARGQPIHDPEQSPRVHRTFTEYKQGGGTSINHFYEKLLLLPERMQTEAGRRLARERRERMERFLESFHQEWNWAAPDA